ncbi:MAG: hypothetical protein EAZ55_08420 [Cytophagales bacterium]|nr:MAG: hypothetical protein EAZ55_08420 [Cytophagales bacterium]
MTLLFENKFLQLFLLESENIIKAVWNTETENMESDDFKVCISTLWQNLLKYKPKALLADTRQFLFPIAPEDQEWYAENIPNFGIDTQKVAMLISEGLVEQLSIEQTIEEDQKSGSLTGYFDDENKALAWINQ